MASKKRQRPNEGERQLRHRLKNKKKGKTRKLAPTYDEIWPDILAYANKKCLEYEKKHSIE